MSWCIRDVDAVAVVTVISLAQSFSFAFWNCSYCILSVLQWERSLS